MSAPAIRTGATPVVAAVAGREAIAALRGMGIWLAAAVATAAAAWLLIIDLRALVTAGILVPADPYRAPLDVALLVLSLYFAVGAAVSTARERESGTLEVLFYGPVDEKTYLAGKLLGLLAAYAALLPVLALCLVLLSAVSGFRLPGTIWASLALSLVPAAMVISFGLLLATGASRVRTAVLVMGLVAAVLLGGTAAYAIILLVPIDNPSSPVLALRNALAEVNAVIRWISPFAYLQRVVAEGAAIGAWRTAATSLGISLLATLAMLALAAVWLRRRGVQKGGE